MNKQDIIREWRRGLKKESIAKEYAEKENKMRKMHGDKTKMKPIEALAIVEPIMFEYQKQMMKGEQVGHNNRGIIKINA